MTIEAKMVELTKYGSDWHIAPDAAAGLLYFTIGGVYVSTIPEDMGRGLDFLIEKSEEQALDGIQKT